MSITAIATKGRLVSVDSQLSQLATDLRRLRGEYAAELDTLYKIDQLLDQRLRLTGQQIE